MARCVTLLGTVSIQDYLFRSNRLKENLGASWIVAEALDEWSKVWRQAPGCREPLFVGGGNAALEFDNDDQARRATEDWSFRLLREYPGLQVSAWHEPILPGDSLSSAYQRAQENLGLRENQPARGCELGSLPVVRECSSTGMGASDKKDGRWLSPEALARTEAAGNATKWLQNTYKKVLNVQGQSCAFPDELGNLGQREGASQIAIVHADGNGIGKIFKAVPKEENDDQFRRRIRAVSNAIKKISQDALSRTLEELSQVLPELEQNGVKLTECSKDEQKELSAQRWYPVRPIVEGGDDLTFVCHGRLGLALAARYLFNFEQQSKLHTSSLGCETLTACAGVLIMPEKFPFARGYRLAERLTDSAKQQRRLKNSSGSWIDFHVLLEGSAGSLSAIRSPYTKGNEQLLLRPYVLEPDDPRSWSGFEKKVQMFQDHWPRSRAKRLLEALAHGQKETERVLEQFKTRGIGLPSDAWQPESGTPNMRTSFFDPLELLDFHTPVPWPELQEKANATGD